MGREKILAWKKTGDERQPGCLYRGVSPPAARALGCPSLPRGWHPVGHGLMTLLHSLEGSQVLGGETSPVQVQAAGAANSTRLGQRASVKRRLHSPPWRAELWYVLQLQDIEKLEMNGISLLQWWFESHALKIGKTAPCCKVRTKHHAKELLLGSSKRWLLQVSS